MSKKLDKLQAQQDQLAEHIASKRESADQVLAAFPAVIDQLVEASEEERPRLVQEHAALVAGRDALADEIAELERRAEVARLTYRELLADVAQAEYEYINADAVAVRLAFQDATEAQLRFLNRGGGRSPDRDKRRIELVELVAGLKAKSSIAERAREQAARNLAAAQVRIASGTC